ncbi:G1/S-specific cyclin-E2 [Willisornis vidua]|uniref:G1/S-specific cyclin-E2 n=1 Tax=Willisornis vidua TaxID=1566151 RepID=A0ABQ9D1K1_9PASS|nr:G1/S-specific cyclin-E2 [Willisornis vidua]
MFQRLNNMFMGEIDSLSSQEPEFSEKEDDEWILVDFIGGLTTIKVETSPMENLLIEHPSMSVYAVHNTCHSLNETGCADEEFHSPGSPSRNRLGRSIRLSSRPVAGCLGEEADSHLVTASLWVVVEFAEVMAEPPLHTHVQWGRDNVKKMSRRSSRLQAKQQQPLSCHEESPQELQALEYLPTRKRRTAEQENKKKEDGKIAKKHQYEIKSCWPPTITGGISPCIIIETPHKEPVTTDFSRFKKYRFRNLFINPSPLPELNWGNSKDVWLNILMKENRYAHCKHFTSLHSSLQPHMRSILLDWLLEVCEVYALHRETFYLAQDFFDRFMLTQKNINKSMLQLIGITSLFIASKLEEIYAPKIQEFAYVTDGACSEDDIVKMELIMLKALKWELCPVTIVSWLNLYLQVDALKDVPKVLLPQYSQEKFIQIAQLLDLCILDVNSLDFQYRTLAAAALCHYTSIEIVKKASGLDWDSISECVEWMVPFVNVAKKFPVKLKNFKKVAAEDRHNIQTHTNYLDMLEEVNSGVAPAAPGQLSPVSTGGIITPPKSTEKK